MPRMLSSQDASLNDVDYLMTRMNISNTTSGTEEDFAPDECRGNASTSDEHDINIPSAMAQKKQHFIRINSNNNYDEWHESLSGYLTSNSPFDTISDLQQKNRKKFIEEIKQLSRSYAEKLHRRILLLKEAAEEEYPYEKLISVASLEGFLNFLKLYEQFKYPDTSITPCGNIRVQWQQDKNHHLAIEFISETDVKFVIFAPDPVHSMKVARVAGKVSIDSIIISIKPYDALEWSTE